MKRRTTIGLTLVSLILTGLMLGACDQLPLALPDEDRAETAAWQTLAAESTRFYVQTLEAQLTEIAEGGMVPVTGASPTPTITHTVTSSPTATATPVPPTHTPTSTATATFTIVPTQVPCNWAGFIADMSIPDGSFVPAGTSFTKTWRLRNIGSCTWTPNYDIVFVGGHPLGASAVVDLDTTVHPGEIVDISVRMTAPVNAGYYTSYWQLRSTQGETFALGDDQELSFWVEIEVPEDLEKFYPDSPLDFTFSYQSATWRSSTGFINVNSIQDYTNGSVYRSTSPHMEEDHTDNEPALIMIPSDGNGGFIYGEYPGVNIQSGDRFDAIIGCTANQPNCDVLFQINYSANNGPTQNLGSWAEVYDGNWTHLNIDLDFLAGQNVEFTLLVFNNGTSDDDRVFWLAPRILR